MPDLPISRTITLRRRAFLFLLDVSLLALLLIALQSRGRLSLARAYSPVETALPTHASLLETKLPAPLQALPGSLPTEAAKPATEELLPPQVQISPVPPSPSTAQAKQGVIFFSMVEVEGSHLFAYHPQGQPLTRLTAGRWDDLAPAASPDGLTLAFASNRDGPWDLYLLDLATGAVTRLTDTPEWEGAPAWSPDGRWLAYETYLGDGLGGLEIYLRALPDENGSAPDPVRLTIDPAADHSPAWSPGGRQIAFISDRTGEAEVWLADLDRVEDRFQNVSRKAEAQESHPAWSPDGSALAWSAASGGYSSLMIWPVGDPHPARSLGTGDWPAWSPDGQSIFTFLTTPNAAYLAGYAALEAAPGSTTTTAGLALAPLPLSETPSGLTWGRLALPQPLPEPLAQAAADTPAPAWQPALISGQDIPAGRRALAPLGDVSTAYPLLQDRVDEAFNALRAETARRTGWDFLASLENAYVPLTTPLFPGQGEDWLYTGRAFAFNPSPLHAGWMVVLREDYGAETYWRVFLRARYQDGAQGRPLPAPPWDFTARANGDPRAYEQGGAPAAGIPGGYWIDFTALAAAYGWERLPALTSWRSAYGAARYNEFILTDGLDWASAMLEIYPPEALITPTAIVPPTHAPTPLPPPTQTPTAAPPTPTPLPTATPDGAAAASGPAPAAPAATP